MMWRQQGREAFSALLKQSISFLDALWDGLATGVDLADRRRAGFWQDIRNHIRQIGHPQMRAAIGDEVEPYCCHAGCFPGRGGFSAYQPIRQVSRPKLVRTARLILAILIEHPN